MECSSVHELRPRASTSGGQSGRVPVAADAAAAAAMAEEEDEDEAVESWPAVPCLACAAQAANEVQLRQLERRARHGRQKRGRWHCPVSIIDRLDDGGRQDAREWGTGEAVLTASRPCRGRRPWGSAWAARPPRRRGSPRRPLATRGKRGGSAHTRRRGRAQGTAESRRGVCD